MQSLSASQHFSASAGLFPATVSLRLCQSAGAGEEMRSFLIVYNPWLEFKNVFRAA